MKDIWEVVIEPEVMEDLLAAGVHFLDVVTLSERILQLCRYLANHGGQPRDAFILRTVTPPLVGVVHDRLVAFYLPERTRYRTWRNLWFRARERRVISVRLLLLLDA